METIDGGGAALIVLHTRQLMRVLIYSRRVVCTERWRSGLTRRHRKAGHKKMLRRNGDDDDRPPPSIGTYSEVIIIIIIVYTHVDDHISPKIYCSPPFPSVFISRSYPERCKFVRIYLDYKNPEFVTYYSIGFLSNIILVFGTF